MTPINLEEIRSRFFPFVTSAGYSVRPVTEAELRSFTKEKFTEVFPPAEEREMFVIPEQRVNALGPLVARYRQLHHEFFLFFDPAGNPVGWQMSEAEDPITFYLRNTGVLPSHRRKGLYSEFSVRLEEYLAALGYERLTSHHVGTNRAILIRKLSDGYSICGLELTERWGALVKMVKLLPEDRRKSFYWNYGSLDHL